MANNRLTWRDVTAPNYSGVNQGFYQANRMLQDALGGLSTSLGDFNTQRQAQQEQDLLNRQLAAEAGVMRQLAAASGDTEATQALLRSLGSNQDVRTDFIEKQIGTNRNTWLTGDTTAENLAQTKLQNDRTNRDNTYADMFRPTSGRLTAHVSGGGGDPFSQMTQEERALFYSLPADEQTRLMNAWSGERTSDLNRRNTRQGMEQSATRFGWDQQDRRDSQLANAAIAYAVGASDDPVEQRAAAVEYVSRNGGNPDVLLRAAANLDQASGNILGTNRGGVGAAGSGNSGTAGGSAPTADSTDTGLTRSERDAVERLRTDVNTARAQNQVPVSDTAIQAGTRNDSVASLYESAVERFPNSLGQLSPDEYTRLVSDVMNQYRGLTTNQAATLVEENFTQGRSLWERMDNIPLIGGFIPTFGAKALLPDAGRRAGVNPERVEEAANFLTSPTSRETAITESQRLRGVDQDLSRGEQILQDLAQRVESARRHATITGNYSNLIEAERDLELARNDLMSDVNFYYGTDPTNEASQVAADMVLPRFADPENPRRTVTRSERRRRNEEANRRNLETAQNRAFANATIPAVREQINTLEAEYMSTPISSPERREIMREIQELRKELERLQELARQPTKPHRNMGFLFDLIYPYCITYSLGSRYIYANKY